MDKRLNSIQDLKKIVSPTGLGTQMAQVMQGLQTMNTGFANLSQQQQQIALYLDASRMTIKALVDTLVNKGIFTKEEWAGIYQAQVAEPMQNMINMMNAAPDECEQLDHDEECASDCQCNCKANDSLTESSDLDNPDSDVQLASEQSEPVTFG